MICDLIPSIVLRVVFLGSAGGPAVPGAPGTTILNKIPGIQCFSGTEREKDSLV